jgi:hypothetical protein
MGYLLFSLSGSHKHPSPAYIRYGATGPTGPVILVTSGAARSDGFTCYAAFDGAELRGCCRGSYSTGVFSSGRTFMGAEMILQGIGNTLPNGGIFIYSAPPP